MNSELQHSIYSEKVITKINYVIYDFKTSISFAELFVTIHITKDMFMDRYGMSDVNTNMLELLSIQLLRERYAETEWYVQNGYISTVTDSYHEYCYTIIPITIEAELYMHLISD